MIDQAKIRNWVFRHWSTIRHKPENGEQTVQAIEPILKEIRDNRVRVCDVIEKMVEDAAEVQRMVTDGTVINDNNI